MKKLFIITTLLFSIKGYSQIYEPVKWSTSIEKISSFEYYLVSTATIDEGWHLYSQDVPEDGPEPTEFAYDDLGGKLKLIGSTLEEEGHVVDDPVFEMKIKYFENKASFKQRVEISEGVTSISGTVEFMVCDDKRCLPPTEIDLIFTVNTYDGDIKSDAVESVHNSSGNDENTYKAVLEGSPPSEEPASSRSLWAIFIIAFFSGFAALLTPCVFPMIPLTVSFFTKQSKTKGQGIRNAVLYGISIVVIYVILGWLVSAIFGADAMNALSTNVWFNIIFFLLLVVFAVSFLGAFEIRLPQSWANKVDTQSNRSGIIGIFFMALALAIVSFSCTGPIVGTLLVEAAVGGNSIGPIIGMLGFSLAIALPFALFAAFPGWMNSLPKSGGWLNTVKVVLGFLELALAFKFLSNADLVLQLHLLEREVFLVIWIAIFGALAAYLFGKIQLPHDSPVTYISVGRLSLGLVVLMFTLYLIPGLWGAPLKIISGFPPPMKYSESPYGVGFSKVSGANILSGTTDMALAAGGEVGEHGIIMFHDYDEGLAFAKRIGKPVMLDFTGHACVNCRKMEQFVWSDPAVLSVLKNDVVMISLYVDDKRELSPDEVVESKLKPGKTLKYIGQKWSEMQAIRYKSNSQPMYVLMDHGENNLVEPEAYNPNVKEYLDWLNKGIRNFKKL